VNVEFNISWTLVLLVVLLAGTALTANVSILLATEKDRARRDIWRQQHKID